MTRDSAPDGRSARMPPPVRPTQTSSETTPSVPRSHLSSQIPLLSFPEQMSATRPCRGVTPPVSASFIISSFTESPQSTEILVCANTLRQPEDVRFMHLKGAGVCDCLVSER